MAEKEIVIDPRFGLPPNIVDVRAKGQEDGSAYYDTTIEQEEPATDSYEDNALLPPSSFEVVSQTVRTASDGSQVVDVVIDLPEIIGSTEVEFRVAAYED